MKNILLALLAGTILTVPVAGLANAKTLVAYYSLTGNTEKAAKIIQKQTEADLYKIETITPYPEEYSAQVKLAKEELESGYLPPIKSLPENIKDYDIIFIGSPVWWGTMATPVRTFLSSDALAGKTVVPFVTHGGGGADNSFTDTAELCKNCHVITDGWSGFKSFTFGLSGWIEKIMAKKE